MFKIDLAKAFDRIEWSFIAQALQHQGFQSDFIDCVHSCITLPTFSVVINDQSFGRFNASRGLRQDCTLLPCLFVLAISELPVHLQQALDDNWQQPFWSHTRPWLPTNTLPSLCRGSHHLRQSWYLWSSLHQIHSSRLLWPIWPNPNWS